ncbi:hypothetical protein BT69DRAFT_595011 [Atractiella rhizophila]|nr:hypothetical protein BT69DRAFT_595011 [Atractiella rhizophila]
MSNRQEEEMIAIEDTDKSCRMVRLFIKSIRCVFCLRRSERCSVSTKPESINHVQEER